MNLREARKRRRLTQTQLALLVGCSQALVWKWEAGVTLPSPAFQKKLTNLLDLEGRGTKKEARKK